MNAKVLVTGGAGFIGSHTVDLLLEQGHEVVVLDNLSSGKLDNLDMQHPNLSFIEGDILEYPLVEETVADCDAVLHLAAIASVPQSIEHPIYTFQVNTQGFLHVLEAIRAAKRPIRLVYASSASVYGDVQALPCDDQAPLTALPLSPYALQKLENERYADLYARLHGIQSLGMRYFNVYGVRQDPMSPYSGVISHFLNAYQRDVPLVIFGDGLQSRDFIAVSEIAAANVLALQAPDAVGAVNVATGHPETLLQLIKSIEATGSQPAKQHFEPARVGDIRSSYATTLKAEQLLGFKSKVPLQEGIKRMVMNSTNQVS